MRTAHADLELITKEDGGDPIALSLGYGMCAEHEYGISKMRSLLGCRDELDGIDRRRIDPLEAAKRLSAASVTKRRKGPDYHVLEMNYGVTPREDLLNNVKAYDIPEKGKEPGYSSSWDERSFRIVASSPKVIEFLKDFQDAALSGNAAVMPLNLSGNNPFSRSSLGLVIIDRMPEDTLEAMRLNDIDQRLLQTQFQELEFEEQCRKLNLAIGAISPRRIDREHMEQMGTDFPLRIWVNSWSDKIETRWYSVESLRDALLELATDPNFAERIEIARMIHIEDEGKAPEFF